MSNKGEERRERNLSDRKVPSIHLICRLGATWFQIWLRTETHTRTRIHTPFTRKQERKRPKEIQTHTNNVIDGKQQNTYTERKVYSHMCHSHTHTLCLEIRFFQVVLLLQSARSEAGKKLRQRVFCFMSVKTHVQTHTPHTHGEADSCVSIHVHASSFSAEENKVNQLHRVESLLLDNS